MALRSLNIGSVVTLRSSTSILGKGETIAVWKPHPCQALCIEVCWDWNLSVLGFMHLGDFGTQQWSMLKYYYTRFHNTFKATFMTTFFYNSTNLHEAKKQLTSKPQLKILYCHSRYTKWQQPCNSCEAVYLATANIETVYKRKLWGEWQLWYNHIQQRHV